MEISLFEHNQTAYDAAMAMLFETGKAAVIHPTGTGKSFVGFKLCEEHPDKTVCWLSPSDYIFRTQLENLAKVSAGYQPENIKFYTYAKLMNMSEGEMASILPDYIILDEFHRCGAREWGRGVQALLELYEDVPILGLSATNVRYLDNQRDMADELFDGNIASEMTLGEAIVRGILAAPKYVVSVFSYQQDLENCRKRVGSVRNKAVRDQAERYLEALRRALEKADGLEDVFAKHMTDRTGKYIVFCANYEHMQEMMRKAPEWFAKVDRSPKLFSVYSADPTASQSFLDFKANEDNTHLRLLYCIDALNEGIHVDGISGVILFRPTVSPIVYKQQIGRALAAHQSHTPVIFDIVNNFENLYSISAIEEEMTAAINYYRFQGEGAEIVNESFRIIDEVKDCRRLFEELNDTLSASWELMYACAKRYYEEHGDLVPENKYKTSEGYSLGSWLNTQRMVRRGTVSGYLSEEQIAKLDAIGMRWETRSDCVWNQYFAELLRYYEEHGHTDVPYLYESENGVALGKWIVDLRVMYNSGIQRSVLTPARIAELDRLGMIWDKIDYIWENYYQALLTYYREHGNANVPKTYRTDDGVALGVWLYNTKRKHRTSGGASLNSNQKERLALLGVDLSYEFSFEKQWTEGLTHAERYYREHGDLLVPRGYKTKDGFALGNWITRLRSADQQGLTDVLSQEMRAQLNRIGMVWETSVASPWDQYYAALLQYHAEHSHIRMTSTAIYKDLGLGAWLNGKKRQYRNGTLPENEKQALDDLGMEWTTVKERQWEEAFSLAEEFYREHGHLNVPRDSQRLNSWVNNQRAKYKKNALTTDQYGRLSEIGMAWELDDAWAVHYAKAEEYYRKNGHLDIPAECVTEDGIKLGQWYRARLSEYQRGLLTEKKANQLEAIGIQKDSVLKRNWMQNYTLAKDFYQQNSHLAVDADYVTESGIRLGVWIGSQREKYKQGRLSPEQIALLEDIDMHWDRYEAKWDAYYGYAVDYYNTHGDLFVPADYETADGVKLGAWLSTQRSKYKSHKLSQKQMARLERLNIVWDYSDQLWHDGYRHAVEYNREYGDLNMKSAYICHDGFKLASWIQNKRTAYKKGRLSHEKIVSLEKLGMNWDCKLNQTTSE